MARLVPRRALVATAALAYSGLAHAHFNLQAPPNWMIQDDSGNPQKGGPCGDAMEQGKTFQPSNVVTPFKAGETIAITIDETVTHPGHYRVALAVNDRSELPDEPMVTAGTQACGTAEVMNPPVFPILADGVLDHTSAFTKPQTIMVKLPDDVTCDKCTLQVLEFMSAHSAPCFYHHCADISISKDGGTGGMSGGGQSGGGAPSAGTGAGGMFGMGGSAGTGAGGLLGMGGVFGMSGTTGSAGMSLLGAGSPSTSGSAGMSSVLTGGASGAGGTSTATNGGSSSTTGGTGGPSNTAAGTPGSGASATPRSDADSPGACSTVPGRTSSRFALLAVFGLAWLYQRRRSRS